MAKPQKAEQDPTAGWTDERVLREFITFARDSADDMGVTNDMANRAYEALERFVIGHGTTNAEGDLVAAIAACHSACKAASDLINVKATPGQFTEALAIVASASEEVRLARDLAGAVTCKKLHAELDRCFDDVRQVLARATAHVDRR